MTWDFQTDPDFQQKLDWAATFVREEVEPLQYVLDSAYDVANPLFQRLVRPLQAEVRRQKLWACHLEPELGGEGYGQVKLALLNEILGRARFAPVVFGAQAPDSGNAEILARFGTPEQKERFLKPLLANEIVSAFSMTEPQGGSDPTQFRTRAVLEGDDWVINGEKWFISSGPFAAFHIVMAVTDPEAKPVNRLSMLLVPADTPGIETLRVASIAGHRTPSHSYFRYTNVRVPRASMLGEPGQGFAVAQTRLGGGRVHHAMRTLGEAQKAFDMVCERVISRQAQGGRLADKQMVQEKIADSWIEIEQFRLLLMRTAWRIDQYNDYLKVRRNIAAIKVQMPKLLHDIVSRALHLHGAYGISDEMPFLGMIANSYVMGLADGPTELHKVTVARQTLRDYTPSPDLFPDYSLPGMQKAADEKFRDVLEGLALEAAHG